MGWRTHLELYNPRLLVYSLIVGYALEAVWGEIWFGKMKAWVRSADEK